MSSSIRRRPQSTQRTNIRSDGIAILPTHHTSEKSSRSSGSGNRLLIGAVVFSWCAALASLLCLKGGGKKQWSNSTSLNKKHLSKVDQEHSDFTPNSQSLLHISADDHANITQFFPCVNDLFMPGSKSEINKILKSDRKKSRIPTFTSLSCAPPNKKLCFRGVYDAFDGLLNEASTYFPNDEGLLPVKGQKGFEHLVRLTDRIALLLESLIMHPERPLIPELLHLEKVKPTILEESFQRLKTYTPGTVQKGHKEGDLRNYGQLHGDYFESDKYVYTAILYDSPSDDLLGGETALVDLVKDTKNKKLSFGMRIVGNETTRHDNKVSKDHDHDSEQAVELTSGVTVEPKRGRLVLFSSGGENIHAPMEVTRGERPTYHFWFKCKSGLKGDPVTKSNHG